MSIWKHWLKKKKKRYDIQGENNKIIIVEADGTEHQLGPNETINGLCIQINANNTFIRIEKPILFQYCLLMIDNDDCTFSIKSSPFTIESTIFHLGAPKATITIGKDFSIGRGGQINGFSSQGKSVIIGDDCMFSFGVIVRPDDGHTILNNKGEIINYGKDIVIGNHVWVGEQALILHGAHVPDNSIIGAKSIVNKSFLHEDKGIIIAGSPAKVVKRDINWSRMAQYNYERNKQ